MKPFDHPQNDLAPRSVLSCACSREDQGPTWLFPSSRLSQALLKRRNDERLESALEYTCQMESRSTGSWGRCVVERSCRVQGWLRSGTFLAGRVLLDLRTNLVCDGSELKPAQIGARAGRRLCCFNRVGGTCEAGRDTSMRLARSDVH